jgi:hypothetical protein
MKLIYLFLITVYASETIYNAINEKKGFIFKQMRDLKQVLPRDTHGEVERLVKQMELKYIISKAGFIEHLHDVYQDMQLNKDKQEEDINEIIFMLESIGLNVKKLDDKSRIVKYIEEQEPLVRDILKYFLEKGHINTAYNITEFIESIPSYILGENGNRILVNKDFRSFLEKINEEYNLESLRSIKNVGDKRKKVDELMSRLKQDHKNWFSSFLEEYINDSVITNDSLKEIYTLKKMKEIDLNKLKVTKRDMFRFKSTNTTNNERNLEEEKEKTLSKELKGDTFNIYKPGTNEVNTTLLTGKTNELIAKNSELITSSQNIQEQVIKVAEQIRLEKENKLKDMNLSGSCKDKLSRLESVLANNQEAEKERMEKAQELLKEIPNDLMNASDPNASEDFIKKMIIDFIIKLIEMIVKHIPFYFFKICIPPGPLVFGCCPEAAFFPTQIYNLFTALDRVDKFIQTAKTYPGWLEEVGKGTISERDYYTCAQGYLTLEESNLFNRCNFLSLIYNNPLNFLGIMPGDSPLCFWACLQVFKF